MLKEQRHSIIMSQLIKNGSASATDLQQATRSSKSTIKRDLDELAEQKLILKVRGGAVLPDSGLMDHKVNPSVIGTHEFSSAIAEPSFRARQISNLPEKQRIARAAHQLVSPNETLLLGSGTTVFEFAKTLSDISALYCATNDLESATILSRFENVSLTVLGGSVRHSHYSLHGYFTEQMISQMHADKVILGIDAVDMKLGYMNFSPEDISTNRCMIRAARKSIILTDHSKFESIAFLNLCAIGDIDILITGTEADPYALEQIRKAGVEVIAV